MAFTLAAVGQALIRRDVLAGAEPATLALVERLQRADAAFTNLEGAIAGRHGGWPMKDKAAHGLPADTLDTLQAMGFGLLSLANNHAGDLGPGGILSTIEEARARGFTIAGTGVDAASAAAPGVGMFAGRRVALVAIDAGPWGEHVYAADARGGAPARPGVNRLRVERRVGLPRDLVERLSAAATEAGHARRSEARVAVGFQKPPPPDTLDFFGLPVELADVPRERWVVDEPDLARHEAAVRSAAAECDLVVVYLHNHHWPPDWKQPPEWLRAVAARLLRAGGDVFLSHGAPVLQGFELIDGKPAAYGLGNFIFHSANRAVRLFPEIWRSALVAFHWHGRRLAAIEAVAVSLGDPTRHGDPDSPRDAPMLWTGPHARDFLAEWIGRGYVDGRSWRLDDAGARYETSMSNVTP